MRAQESEEDLVQTLAESLLQRGWKAPAVVLLELLKPFSFVCSQLMLLGEPLFGPLGGRVERYVRLLEDRSVVERLLETLEAKESK